LGVQVPPRTQPEVHLDLNSSDAPHDYNSDSFSTSILLDDAFDDVVIRLSEQDIQPPVTAPQIVVLKPALPKTETKTKPERHGAASASVRSINAALREPSKAGDQSSDGGQPAIAPPGHLQTVQDMPNQGLALKHQTDALIANIRVRRARVKSATSARVRMKLADILPINGPSPLLDIPPTTRAISTTGRIRVTVSNRTLAELLGWTPVDEHRRRLDWPAELSLY
jgi:hypothetical protein